MSHRLTCHRQFWSQAKTASAAPYFFSRTRILADKTLAKNDRLAIGFIAARGKGISNLRAVLKWCDLVPNMAVDDRHASKANSTLARPHRQGYAIET